MWGIFIFYSFVCTGGSTIAAPVDDIQGHICPRGHYCPQGTEYHIGCDVGYYANVEGLALCIACPIGMMCDEVNTTDPQPCKKGKTSHAIINVERHYINLLQRLKLVNLVISIHCMQMIENF